MKRRYLALLPATGLRAVEVCFRDPAAHEAPLDTTTCSTPFEELRRHVGMLAAVDKLPESGGLEASAPQIEGKGDKGIILTVGEGYPDEPKDGLTGEGNVLREELLSLLLGDGLGDLLTWSPGVAISPGHDTGRAWVGRGFKMLKTFY